MWEKLFDAFASLFSVGVKVEKHEQEIKELRNDNRQLLDLVRFLAAEIHRVSARQDLDRDKIELYIENQLLKFEKNLPSGRKQKSNEKD
ncbi:MAG: hypothetical protein ACR2HG_07875 [Pyrinomonadaceae bacterium]